MSKKRFVLFALAVMMLMAALITGGCGGSSSKSSSEGGVSPAEVCVIGTPTGELADAILDAQTTDSIEELGQGDIVILARSTEIQEYADELREAYERGVAVAVENAEPEEIQAMLGLLDVDVDDDEIISSTTSYIFAVARKGNDTLHPEIFTAMKSSRDELDVSDIIEEYATPQEANNALLSDMIDWTKYYLNKDNTESNVRSSVYRYWKYYYKVWYTWEIHPVRGLIRVPHVYIRKVWTWVS